MITGHASCRCLVKQRRPNQEGPTAQSASRLLKGINWSGVEIPILFLHNFDEGDADKKPNCMRTVQTNIQSETPNTFRNVLRTETVSLSRRHGGRYDILHIQLVIYESCTHIAHLRITIPLPTKEAAFPLPPPTPISIFVPVDFSLSAPQCHSSFLVASSA